MRISDWSSDVCSPDLRFNRKAGIYGSDSSEVGILGIALNDLTHDDMAHIRRSDARALYCFLDNKLTQSCRREILEPTTKVTNGSADTGERSEEHTSELQSLMRNSSAVFGLKKQNKHK